MLKPLTTIGRNARQWLARVLVVCFALRALVPMGFMPAFSAANGGTLSMVICSAQGTKTITIALDGRAEHEPGQPTAHESCPFAVGAVASPLPASPAISIALTFIYAPPSQQPVGGAPLRRVGPALGSRGPPAQV